MGNEMVIMVMGDGGGVVGWWFIMVG